MKVSPLLLLLLFAAVFLTISSFTKQKSINPKNGYYVVIAAYASSREDYAMRFTNKVKSAGDDATYVFFEKKNMYFVYLEYFSDRSPSIQHMREVRKNTTFDDAWVYVFKDGSSSIASDQEEPKNPEHKADQSDITSENKETDKAVSEPLAVDTEEMATGDDENIKEPKGKYKVYFQLTHDQTTDEISGNIDVIDPGTGNVISVLEANQLHYVDPPNRNNEQIQFEADVFGFRKAIHTVDLGNPESDKTEFIVKMYGDTVVVFFDLIRFRRGDTFTMYHVYFFTSTAVMRPESQNELNDLLAMLKQNPGYNIKLHGFVNGNGKVDAAKYHPDNDSNFFTSNDALMMDMSAKDLSQMRAQTVRNYLVHNGVESNRIEVKGWGGKKAIYKTTDPRADKNIRVEVEILK